jgi:hypothetical protein
MSEQQPPSPSQEGKVMATQDDIDTKQEELDAELKEVRFVCPFFRSLWGFRGCVGPNYHE